MDVKTSVELGSKFPFDATDEWWEGDGSNPPLAESDYHIAARAIMANLSDRKGFDNLMDEIDEETRIEIVKEISNIIESLI